MTTEDLSHIQAMYDATHGNTALACSGSLADIQAHQTSLEEAMGGIMSAITFYDGEARRFQHLRDQMKDRKRVLELDAERTKRSYWNLRDEEKRANLRT